MSHALTESHQPFQAEQFGLFDQPSIWQSNPRVAFDNFVTSSTFSPGRLLRSSSIVVYRSMWGKFSRWLTEQGLMVDAVGPPQIARFVQDGQITGQTQVRYLKLLHRVYAHLLVIGVLADNPLLEGCDPAVSRPPRHLPDPLPLWLDQADRERFLSALPDPSTWQHHRNRAMIACMLGGGLKTGHAIQLKIASIMAGPIKTVLRIYPSGIGRWHTTLLDETSSHELGSWLARRRLMNMAGTLVFPANETGCKLHASTVWRQTQKCFERAGIELGHRGASILRHTFAMRAFEDNQEIDIIKEHLGHHRYESTQRYQEIVENRRPIVPNRLS